MLPPEISNFLSKAGFSWCSKGPTNRSRCCSLIGLHLYPLCIYLGFSIYLGVSLGIAGGFFGFGPQSASAQINPDQKPEVSEALSDSIPQTDFKKPQPRARSSSETPWYQGAFRSLQRSKNGLMAYANEIYGALEIRLDGVKHLNSAELQALIPSGESYYWWLSNQPSIEAALRQHPLVQAADVHACPAGAPMRCFEISITEREPTLWVKAEWDKGVETRFLIADDGAVLAVLRADEQMRAASRFDQGVFSRFSAETLTSLPVLDARDLTNVSDASEQLFKRAVELVATIQKEAASLHGQTGSSVYQLRFIGNHEVEVEFASQPFKVVFNVDESESLSARIAVQMLRLDKILEAKPLLASRAVSINLGLDREAFAVLANSAGIIVPKSGSPRSGRSS